MRLFPLPYEISSTPPMVTDVPLGSKLLMKDMTGSDVKELQEALTLLGYSLPLYGADGDFGNETEKALKAFQKTESLTMDGKYGDKSHAALMDALADDETGDTAPFLKRLSRKNRIPHLKRSLSFLPAARSISAKAIAPTMPASRR